MKNIFILAFILYFVSCGKTNSKESVAKDNYVLVEETQQMEIISEQIDTCEFVNFWEDFKESLLERNIPSLSLMINDTLFIAHPLLGYGYLPNFKFIEKINLLYSISYLSIIQKYNINNGLHFTSIDPEKYSVNTYFCTTEKLEQIYYKNAIIVIFGYEREYGTEKTVFGFTKLHGKIKLFSIYYLAMSVTK